MLSDNKNEFIVRMFGGDCDLSNYTQFIHVNGCKSAFELPMTFCGGLCPSTYEITLTDPFYKVLYFNILR